MKRYLITAVLSFAFLSGSAQFPMSGGGGMKGMNTNVGHYYGTIIDSISGKPIEYVIVQLFGNKYDTASKSMKYGLLTGDLTKSNGEFSLENLPIFGSLDLKITAMGYVTRQQKVAFNVDMQKIMKSSKGNSNSDNPTSGYSGAMNAVDKDLGNIKLAPDVTVLGEVKIEDRVMDVEIKLDKKIYNVEKNITSTGGNAEDVLKNVPSVTVDMDGNVSMRNSSPTIFVDGRPTTLTLDQIPADAISSIEVISNPSAKYDASGGMGGIINIVLKKNRKTGYNGSLRLGVDQRLRLNGGGDFNVREQKVNFFISAFGNQRMSRGYNETSRYNLIGNPATNLFQTNPGTTDGLFGFGRIGFDYFINNRNTLTLSQNFGFGNFTSYDSLFTRVDTVRSSGTTSSNYERNSLSERLFQNLGSSLLYKHLYPKEGRELTADVSFNSNKFSTKADFNTTYYDANGAGTGFLIKQKQEGGGGSWFLTAQSDFTTPIKTDMKIETGIRASVKDYNFNTDSYLFDPLSDQYVLLTNVGADYIYNDQVYAAYATFSDEIKKFTYQAGMRLESSVYSGKYVDSTDTYFLAYPVAPFPSAFLTYHVNDKNDLQLSYSRKINRPNFFQLIPATDYSDSLNVRRGNPGLLPEFTNSVELSYLKNFNRSNNFMLTAFYKRSSDLITNYQELEFNPVLNRDVVINTYTNALESNSYGVEVTTKNAIKWFEISTNANFYYSVINATNVDSDLVNERFNWFAKVNLNFKLPKNMSIQLNGKYTAKSNLPISGSGGGRWGGMGGGGGGGYEMMHGGASATAQGYSLASYYLDAAFRIDFLKEKKASLTLNVEDVLKTRTSQTHSESDYLIQDTKRTRDQLFFRLSFSYRFGKFDVSLFKRKNMKMNTDGLQDMGGGM
jgi:outer membrane receptor protein involved in Fe transport